MEVNRHSIPKQSNKIEIKSSFCKKRGHLMENCFKKQINEANSSVPSLKCYGCGAPGVTRANC